MKQLKLLVFILVVVLILGCVEHKTTPEDVLEKAIEKCNSSSYEVTMVEYIAFKNTTSKSKKVEYGTFKGDKFKIVGNGSMVVSNGSVVWAYNNNTKSLVINDFSRFDKKPRNSFVKFLSSLLKNYRLDLKVSNSHYVVSGVSELKHTPIKSERVWIDKKTFMPSKFEVDYELYGLNLTYVMMCKDLKFKKIDDSAFEVVQPKARAVVNILHFQEVKDAQERVNFTILKPSISGFKLDRIDVIEQNIKEVVMYYVNKEKCFLAIFESPRYEITGKGEEIKLPNVKAFYSNVNGNKIEFRLKNVTIEIISDCLDKQELVEVSKSLLVG